MGDSQKEKTPKEIALEMSEKNRQLFTNLGIHQEEFLQELHNPQNFSPEQWRLLQSQRESFQAWLERELCEEETPKQRTQPTIAGHWIFVR